jgi:hypothetical protein
MEERFEGEKLMNVKRFVTKLLIRRFLTTTFNLNVYGRFHLPDGYILSSD